MTAKRSGGWRGGALALGVAILGVGCLKSPQEDEEANYQMGADHSEVESLSGKYSDSSAEIEPGYLAPPSPGTGHTLTRSYVPPPRGADPRTYGRDDVDLTTAPLSELGAVRGSAATGAYVHLEEGIGGSGTPELSLPEPRDTVNPGRGTIPQREGSEPSQFPTAPEIPMEQRYVPPVLE